MIILNELFRGVIRFVLIIILVLIGVAFLTLLERKVLGYIQIRKGPNKVGFIGILQPFRDAIKLITKEGTYPIKSNFLVYYFCPVITFILVFLRWMLVPYFWGIINFNFGILFFIVCLSLGVYGIIIAGWSSNSSYALLGGLRAVAQTISYEVRLSFIFINIFILCGRYNFIDFYFFQELLWFIFLNVPIFIIFFTSLLAETNRTPFDFAEGESELVSGFNVEYRRGGFVLIFLGEYSRIIIIRLITTVIFLGRRMIYIYIYIIICIFAFSFIWLRSTFPRYRYDKLINLCWKSFLPVSLFILISYFCIVLFLNSLLI